MSKITLSGNPSGTGTFTIASPSGNTDRTLTLPDATGTVVTADGSGNIATTSITPSAGIYLGGSGSANLLDDYEEGTWTPRVLYGGSDTGQTYTHQVGTYTKVGRVVIYQASVQVLTNSSSTGNLSVGGLPFTSSTTTNLTTLGSALLDNAAASLDQPVGRVNNNTTEVLIIAGTGANNATALDNSVRGSSFRVQVAGHYITD